MSHTSSPSPPLAPPPPFCALLTWIFQRACQSVCLCVFMNNTCTWKHLLYCCHPWTPLSHTHTLQDSHTQAVMASAITTGQSISGIIATCTASSCRLGQKHIVLTVKISPFICVVIHARGLELVHLSDFILTGFVVHLTFPPEILEHTQTSPWSCLPSLALLPPVSSGG